MQIIIILIIIILTLIFFQLFNKAEKRLIEGLNTFNGRMAIDDQYFYDKLFDDVVYYPNEYKKESDQESPLGELITTGWEKCKLECPGHCVEYGVHGSSYCFAK